MVLLHTIGKNISLFLSVLANIGTFISAILVYITIREMREQRNQSLKPDIMLLKTDYYVYYDRSEKRHRQFLWSSSYLEDMPECSEDIGIRCINVGLETAKSIEIKWEFEYSTIKNMIEKYDTNRLFVISQDDRLFSISGSLGGTMTNNLIEYILPLKMEESPYVITLPCSYIEYIQVLLYLALDYSRTEHEEDWMAICDFLFNLPPLCLSIHYLDIAGNKYKKTYNVQHEFSNIKWFPEDFTEEIAIARGRIFDKNTYDVLRPEDYNFLKAELT